jgi:uncharacterized membrane protein YhaH (DUF805 family)
MRRTWRRAVLVSLTLGLSALGLAACSDDDGGTGDVDDFTFSSLDVDYRLSRADDGTSRLRVVETFVAEFPDTDQNHGMRRTIPDTYNGQPLLPSLVSITDADGEPREAETESEDGAFSMTSGADGFVHGEQTYVFMYELRNVTWNFSDTGADEFYWDVNGDDWAQPFGRVTATLRVDPALVPSLTGEQTCYAGAHGSEETCAVTADGGTVTASVTDLAPYETMTVAVGFEPGTFAPFDSRYLVSPGAWIQLPGALLVIAALVWTVAVRVRRLRDAPGRPTIIAEYTPPDIDALESAVFLGKTSKAIPAEVLEQAVAGSVRIEEGERAMFSGAKLKAVLVDRARADEDGRTLLDGLFGGGARAGAEFAFGSSNTRLATASRQILAEAARALKRRGLYRSVPTRVRVLPGLLLAIGATLAVVGGVVAIESGAHALAPILLLILAILAVFVFFVLIAHRPLSAAGAELRDHLQGLKEFIHWAEADRIRMLQSPRGAERMPVNTGDSAQLLKIYEPLLPYAVVFGQEKEWAERLAVLYGDDVSPGWYVGAGAFNAAAFSSGIGSLSATASASSSTSGGASGGGSAGGGGGGGGGGGV